MLVSTSLKYIIPKIWLNVNDLPINNHPYGMEFGNFVPVEVILIGLPKIGPKFLLSIEN